jgi:hypothetical protein
VPESGGNDGRMENEENQNQVFPSFPTGLGNRFAIPTFPPLRPLLMFLKGAPNTNPKFQPPSGSFFNEKMLVEKKNA